MIRAAMPGLLDWVRSRRVNVLGVAVRASEPLGGGAARAELADGRTVVVKNAEASSLAAEAAGLRWLRVPGGTPVPAVLDVDPQRLVTEFVPRGATRRRRPRQRSAASLAHLHAAGAPAFGAAPPDGPSAAWIGRAPMRNEPSAELAASGTPSRPRAALPAAAPRRRATLTGDEAAVVERVCDRLPALAGPAEPPARLHGDLWSGNVLWSRRAARG